jgi:hypothetical protein
MWNSEVKRAASGRAALVGLLWGSRGQMGRDRASSEPEPDLGQSMAHSLPRRAAWWLVTEDSAADRVRRVGIPEISQEQFQVEGM